MKFQCTTCDIDSKNEFDSKFNYCRENHHEIMQMLDKKEVAGSAVTAKIDNNIYEQASLFAQNPYMLGEIERDLDKVHVGDKKNKVLALILLASSKRKEHEQAIIIQKQSSAGGSNLQNSLLEYFDDKIKLTRMTAAYLDRSGEDYSGKILAIGEMSGFDSASSSLRQKLSEGKTELATTDKDEKGRIITSILRTEGRPSLITTTTSLEIHTEFENRCWILDIDETSQQTKAVNKYQFAKDTFEYQKWTPRADIKAVLNSGVLEDLKVVNPFEETLGENFPCDRVTARRDSKRFADLTTTITYLHQFQRVKIQTKNQTNLLVAYEDLKLAIYYSQEALKNTLNKLDKKAEAILEYMKSCQKEKELHTRNDLCNALEIPYETMKRILTKLVDRSFVEEKEVDRVWKYKLTNKSMIDGISLGSEEDFTKRAIEYLQKNAQNFEKIVLPVNHAQMQGPDKKIIDYLLSFDSLVTVENGDTPRTNSMRVTTSPPMRVTDTDAVQTSTSVTTKSEEDV
jgi:predicted transcriptional regulator